MLYMNTPCGLVSRGVDSKAADREQSQTDSLVPYITVDLYVDFD